MNISTRRFNSPRKSYLFPAWNRPDLYWDVVVAHFPIALVTGLGLFLPLWVSCRSLPLLRCTFLAVTGFPCPFCGFTRSFWAISSGDWYYAAVNYPLSLGIYGLTALFFAWHATALLLGIRMESRACQLYKSPITWWVTGALFFLNWVYRISSGLI